MIKVDKIVIVGGGSAGWMSATTMIKAFPEKEIVVIESPDYPTIGVGESTLGAIRSWTKFIDLDEKDFMPSCDAVYKMSIKFTDFYKKDAGSFHYPFGFVFTAGTIDGLTDWYAKKILNPDLDVADYARTFIPALTLAEQNKISLNESGRLGNFKFTRDVAYHFDAAKFGEWLKFNYCLPRGVKLIPATVTNVVVGENGIESLNLSDGKKIEADLFIDCTGFKSLLLEKALGESFIDLSNMLPNNRAWATRIPYTVKQKEMEPFTNCTAIENGWVWNIPSWERIGTGYVYSDKYVSPDQALIEFKNHLKSSKMTHFDENRDVDSFEYKDIRFKTGIHDRTWVKNVVAIGFAAGFIEPLESSGLFTVHEFLMKLVKTLHRGEVTQWDSDAYNMATKKQFLDFAEFVAMHYALSRRDDTKYWQDVTNRSFQPNVPDLTPSRTTTFESLAESMFNLNKYEQRGGLHFIATGLNYFPVDKATIEEWELYYSQDYYQLCQQTFQNWKAMREEWQKEADLSSTMYDYLSNNIYNRE